MIRYFYIKNSNRAEFAIFDSTHDDRKLKQFKIKNLLFNSFSF